MTERVLVVGLDGYDVDLARQLMGEGRLPALADLERHGQVARLDHGSARRMGLAMEHFSSGLSPEAGNRWSAVHFDSQRYRAWQEDVRFPPFTRHLDVPTVVFDTPYWDLAADPSVRGVVSWGAHDPGAPLASQPGGLLGELLSRFGHYPAPQWIYGYAWADADRSAAMGSALAAAVDRRAEATAWLFGDRLPDWQLAITVISELHSASEGLWHGVDEGHPLHGLPSAAPARAGIVATYEAVDRMVAGLVGQFSDATVVLFSMHGMGRNESDPASMALLPELMLRHFLGRSLLSLPEAWQGSTGEPLYPQRADRWEISVADRSRARSRLARGALEILRPAARRLLHRHGISTPSFAREARLAWMPAARYRALWRDMPAFALPSFYDGRIRVNLRGRESAGRVSLAEYGAFCEKLSAFLRECVDPVSGEAAVRSIEASTRAAEPLAMADCDADLTVVWSRSVTALAHPKVGTIGPVPWRRPGGHTGGDGLLCLTGASLPAADLGTRSAFDVVPTLFQLFGRPYPAGLSGRSAMAIPGRVAANA